MEQAKLNSLKKIAANIRLSILEGVHSASSGHPGGSLSIADIITYLYFEEMNIDPKNPKMPDRDRLVLSKGHTAPALYAALAEKGITLKYTDSAAKLIAEKSYSHKFGARNMRRYIQKNVEDQLAELIISDYNRSYTQALVNVKDGEISVNCM